MRYLRRHWPLLIVLLIYVTIATAHSLTVPLTTGNDEWAHFLYLRFIAEHGSLPATPAERDEAGYKSDAPPLYHLIVTAVTAGVEPVRLLRPLDSPRRELADNVTSPYALVHTGAELPPYRGEVLLWHLGRGTSIFFGLLLIGITYFTSLELFPGCRKRASMAATFPAFAPVFIFHSSVLSYESLSAVLTALFLLVGIKAIKQPQRWFWWLALGGLAGLSVTAKYSAILLPVEIIFIAWLSFWVAKRLNGEIPSRQIRNIPFPTLFRRYLLLPVLLAGLAAILAASWWFGFVVWHFNKIETQGPVIGVLEPLLIGDASDTTSVGVGKFLFGRGVVEAEQRPLLARNYGQIFRLMLDSFWAAPVAGQFVLSPWLSLLFGLMAALGLAGLWRVRQKNEAMTRVWLVLLLFHTMLIVPLLVVRLWLSFDPREVAQGRHLLLPAASALSILLIWGWSQWSSRIGQLVIIGLLLWSVWGQLGRAAAAYPPPIPVWTEQPPETQVATQPVGQTFGKTMRLTAFTWRETPGKISLEVTLWWEALAEMSQDYLVELTLSAQSGDIAGYSLSHPVQGRYPTRAWEPGDVVQDVHWLPLVDPPAGNYQLHVRLLTRAAQPLPTMPTVSLGEVPLTIPARQPDSCAVWSQGQPERDRFLGQAYRLRSPLTVIGPDQPILKPAAGQPNQTEQTPLVSVDNFHIFVVGPDWAESYQLVVGSTACHHLTFDLPPRNFTLPEIPHPLEANFNNEVKVLGYDLPTRRIQPGGRLPLTLYWQALGYIGEDYQIFANPLDSEQRRWGGYDRRARDGYSTLLWVPGEVITDAFGLPLDPDAPPGVYTLDLGLYRQTEAGAVSLPLMVDGQPGEQTSIRLGPIKVGGPPPDVMTNNPAPQIVLNQSFGGQITLLGYDLTGQNGQAISTLAAPVSVLELTLYWRADTAPPVDYTTFLHLRDASNQLVAQKDAPPANGRYPTSLWDSGEIIVDEILLPLDSVPAGRYTLVVGLYTFEVTDLRLLGPDNPANEITLETIELP